MNLTQFCLNSFRMRLGWSQAELIRYLGCSQSEYLEWQSAGKIPAGLYFNKISSLEQHAERSARRILHAPLAEKL